MRHSHHGRIGLQGVESSHPGAMSSLSAVFFRHAINPPFLPLPIRLRSASVALPHSQWNPQLNPILSPATFAALSVLPPEKSRCCGGSALRCNAARRFSFAALPERARRRFCIRWRGWSAPSRERCILRGANFIRAGNRPTRNCAMSGSDLCFRGIFCFRS